MGSPEGQIIEQAYVILLKLDKNKEVLVSNDWGKIGKKTWRNFVGSKSLLNMTLSLRIHVGLGCSIHRSHHHGHITPSAFGVNATNPSCQFRRYVQEKSLREFTCVSSAAIHLRSIFSWPPPWTLYPQIVFTSIKIICSIPCHRCGIH